MEEQSILEIEENYRQHMNIKLKQVRTDINQQYQNIIKKCDDSSVNTKLKEYFNVNNILKKSIEINLNNLLTFLNEFDLTENNLNRKDYVEKAIFNEELLKKINLTQYKLSFGDNHSNHLSEEINRNIRHHAERKMIKNFLFGKDKQAEGMIYLKERGSKIKNIHIEGIDSKTEMIFDLNTIYEVLDTILISNCVLNKVGKDIRENAIKEKERFPELKELVFINSTFQDESFNYSLYPFVNIQLLPSITILKIEKAQLVDQDFKKIFETIICSTTLKDSLITLSFAHNYLTCINYPLIDGDSTQFLPYLSHLEELSFMNNRIYQFTIKYVMAERLRFLNLTNNYIGSISDIVIRLRVVEIIEEKNKGKNPEEDPKCIKLYNQNPFLIEKQNIDNYVKVISKTLTFLLQENAGSGTDKDKIDIPSLTMFSYSGLFSSETQEEMLMLLAEHPMSKLKELDLSYCSITSDSASKIFQLKYTALKMLILKGNHIDISLFKKMKNIISNNLSSNYPQLEELNLSSNYIEDEDFTDMIAFLNGLYTLNHLDLTLNPFGRNYSCSRKKEKQEDVREAKGKKAQKEYCPYSVEDSEKKESNCSFCGLIGAFYPGTKKFYLDFTVDLKDKETKDVICFIMEQQKKEYLITRKGNK